MERGEILIRSDEGLCLLAVPDGVSPDTVVLIALLSEHMSKLPAEQQPRAVVLAIASLIGGQRGAVRERAFAAVRGAIADGLARGASAGDG